jgi:hypothetical protein
MKAGRQWHKLHLLAWEADLHVDASPVDKLPCIKNILLPEIASEQPWILY